MYKPCLFLCTIGFFCDSLFYCVIGKIMWIIYTCIIDFFFRMDSVIQCLGHLVFSFAAPTFSICLQIVQVTLRMCCMIRKIPIIEPYWVTYFFLRVLCVCPVTPMVLGNLNWFSDNFFNLLKIYLYWGCCQCCHAFTDKAMPIANRCQILVNKTQKIIWITTWTMALLTLCGPKQIFIIDKTNSPSRGHSIHTNFFLIKLPSMPVLLYVDSKWNITERVHITKHYGYLQ
jgi:hypothetical protein